MRCLTHLASSVLRTDNGSDNIAPHPASGHPLHAGEGRGEGVLTAGDCAACGSLLGDHDARYCALCGRGRCVRCAVESDIRASSGWRWYCPDCLDNLTEFDLATAAEFAALDGEHLPELRIDRAIPTGSPPDEGVGR